MSSDNTLFSSAADTRIRRLLIAAWDGAKYLLMHEIYICMPEDRKPHPLALTMRFKLAIHDGDVSTGKEFSLFQSFIYADLKTRKCMS